MFITLVIAFWLIVSVLMFITHGFADLEAGRPPFGDSHPLIEVAMCLAWPVLLPAKHFVEYFKEANKS